MIIETTSVVSLARYSGMSSRKNIQGSLKDNPAEFAEGDVSGVGRVNDVQKRRGVGV
jgi:hypothetical protein